MIWCTESRKQKHTVSTMICKVFNEIMTALIVVSAMRRLLKGALMK